MGSIWNHGFSKEKHLIFNEKLRKKLCIELVNKLLQLDRTIIKKAREF